MLGRTLIFAGLALGAAYAVVPRVAVEHAADQSAGRATPTVAATRIGPPGSVTLTRDGDSHFRADALVNGRPVRMLVDSGASLVVLTEQDAANIGIRPAASAYVASARTAGGTVPVAMVTIDRISIGTIERRQVAAAVVRGDALPQSLLGQSFLGTLNRQTVAGEMMSLQ